MTQTSKLQKRQLRSERWECDEPVWFRPGRDDGLRHLEPEDQEALRAAFVARGRESQLI